MIAKSVGMAIVLVTYDAMIHKQGQSSTASKEFSAIWPECTGVFVASGSDGTGTRHQHDTDRMDAITKDEQRIRMRSTTSCSIRAIRALPTASARKRLHCWPWPALPRAIP